MLLQLCRRVIDLTFVPFLPPPQVIFDKAEAGKYKSVDDCIKDLVLVCDNAISFYDPQSLPHRDAQALKDAILKASAEEIGLEDVESPVQVLC